MLRQAASEARARCCIERSLTRRLLVRLAEPRSRRGQPLALHPSNDGELPLALLPDSSQETGACGTKARASAPHGRANLGTARELPGATTWRPLTGMPGGADAGASTPPGSANRPKPGSCRALRPACCRVASWCGPAAELLHHTAGAPGRRQGAANRRYTRHEDGERPSGRQTPPGACTGRTPPPAPPRRGSGADSL